MTYKKPKVTNHLKVLNVLVGITEEGMKDVKNLKTSHNNSSKKYCYTKCIHNCLYKCQRLKGICKKRKSSPS